jgi:acyl-CoA reductase-like NAD-dependent aldehyde dehydrogenase
MQKTLSPIDESVVAELAYHEPAAVDAILDGAQEAQRAWRSQPLDARIAAVQAFVDGVLAKKDLLAEELTRQMGRPLSQTPGELAGFQERAETMMRLAPEALAPVEPGPKEGFTRYITREPLGVVLVLAPWNYPYLTAVNALVPALLAGNAVVLKHSDQTPLVAERLAEVASETLPPGLLRSLVATHDTIGKVVADARVDHVCFTGSVEGGHAVHRAAAGRFIATGLELGGKDPAYVAADADLDFTVPNVMDGAFFNSGQSCCGIERIYVHESLYDRFVEAFVEATKGYVLGDPMDPATNLGPVARARSAATIQAQIDSAIAAGATAHIESPYPGADRGPTYLGPQVLTGVDHSMTIMSEETFGPVVGIQQVADDDEAVRLMNDSRYGLTASIWTPDLAKAQQLGGRLETGTVFMNRCDYLDPELAWVGVKDSGRGATLSKVGFEYLTRPKSFHLRHAK